jgi:hypothetical protein
MIRRSLRIVFSDSGKSNPRGFADIKINKIDADARRKSHRVKARFAEYEIDAGVQLKSPK